MIIGTYSSQSPFFGGQRQKVLRANKAEDLRAYIEKLAKDDVFRQAYLTSCKDVVSEVFGPVDGESASRYVS